VLLVPPAVKVVLGLSALLVVAVWAYPQEKKVAPVGRHPTEVTMPVSGQQSCLDKQDIWRWLPEKVS
jgi:hypothetical protein